MKPGKGLFIAALLWLFLGAAAFFSGFFSLLWLLFALCLLPFVVADALILRFLCSSLSVRRDLPPALAQGETANVRISLRREGSFLPPKILLFDIYPPLMDCQAFPAPVSRESFKGRRSALFEYSLVPRDRGPWNFPGMEFLFSSPLRFWQRRVFYPCPSRGRTFPNFKRLGSGEALRGLRDRQGQREIRRRGQGMEFHGLRDFEEGDPVRDIDWRATARRLGPGGAWKYVVREYQEEQDQQVLCILDTGYRLHRSQFDSALYGALLLSYTALKHGDAAAAMSFGAQERWIPPRKGLGAFTTLMNRLYDLECSSAPSSPFSALESALARLHRRTFIVLISNFREEDGESLSWILPRLRRRHLLLLVSFREGAAESLAEGLAESPAVSPARGPENRDSFPAGGAKTRGPEGPPGKAGTLETAAAFSYLASRKRLYRSWEHLGLLTLETRVEHLSSALLNRYLEVKRSGKL
jgi:uncharacterized protein (DUF58 family)